MNAKSRKTPAKAARKAAQPGAPARVGRRMRRARVAEQQRPGTIRNPKSPTPTTKAATVLAALQRERGATLEELMAATGWQAHSVRGFLSGTVRKRLQLPLLTEDTAAGRRYRLAAAAPAA